MSEKGSTSFLLLISSNQDNLMDIQSRKTGNDFLFCCLILLGLSFCQACQAAIIKSSNPLVEGQTLSSPGGIYELGFFRPNNSSDEYLGIWLKNLTPLTVLWVANRGRPALDSLANLTIGSDGNLILVDVKRNVLWSTDANSTDGTFAELLNNGNLVLKDVVSGRALWESFNYPTDTLLANSSLIYNVNTREKRVLTSWKSDKDPSPGEYVMELVPQIPAQAFIMKDSTPYWRSGPWSKTRFVGIPQMVVSLVSSYGLVQNIDNGTGSFSYYTYGNSRLSYMVLSPEGLLKVMLKEGKGWEENFVLPNNPCDLYGVCGPFGVCVLSEYSERAKCTCLKGFVPKSIKEWKRGNWTGGCVRHTELSCGRNASTADVDVLYSVPRSKLPDGYEYVQLLDGDGCYELCQNNCSCSAVAFVTGIGCLFWTGELIDIEQFPVGGEQFFIRLARSEIAGNRRTKVLVPSIASVFFALIVGVVAFGFWRCRAKKLDRSKYTPQESAWRKDLEQIDVHELHFFDISTILAATDNFSMINKLGQGGFGPVYKGILPDGKEIAVKRLSSNSGQGIEEFKNEIVLISKLQHRNLVRLLGCCIEKEENLLVYEFMINKSLDSFLFDRTRKKNLDWPTRFTIIHGIARGMLYLHRDSCLRVVHRDLKVSNILLDEKMNPKISDFGLARMFEGTQDRANTRKVVGTLGYMSPEYAFAGMFSEKSDVYSFGVLLLEIVTGRKGTSFSYDDQIPSLLSFAWNSWGENKGFNIADAEIADSSSASEITRCIQIALLCVQDQPADRPDMSEVVSMLNSEMELPEPKEPTFAFPSPLNTHIKDSRFQKSASRIEITLSEIQGR